MVAETKDYFGLYELDIKFNGKKVYRYMLNSEYAVRQIKHQIKKGRHGNALKLLKEFNLKEMAYEQQNQSQDK